MTAAVDIRTESATSQARHHEELVNNYHTLVRKIAYRVLRKLPDDQISVELDDLVNIGMLGLFDADTKYDPEAGQSFESFAEFRIRGAMLDELRKRDFFPRRLRAKANRLQRAETKLRTELGREPTKEELCEEMDLTLEQFQKLRRDTLPYSFVDQSDPTIQLRDDSQSPYQAVFELERHHVLVAALERLSDREQLILDLYFNQEFAQREIAQLLDLTEGRISQIKSAALKKLRGILREEL
jgi:RNA polymerase sigma factor for flagellar operon FliA